MIQQNKPKKDRSVVNRSKIQTQPKIIVTRDNPLYDAGPEHVDYQNLVKQDTSILDIPDTEVVSLSFEDIASIPINPYNPPTTSTTAKDPATSLSLLPPSAIIVDTVLYTTITSSDGTLKNTVTVKFTDASGAANYEIAVKEVV